MGVKSPRTRWICHTDDMVEKKSPLRRSDTAPAPTAKIDAFLESVAKAPAPLSTSQGRLIFALDATASRQPTWNEAMALQQNLFLKTEGLHGLDVQLVFFRGEAECRATPWHTDSTDLLRAMKAVRCAAGRTQIERVLRHARNEADKQPVSALVLVGDCCEELLDPLAGLAGELKLLGTPVFAFQEGNDPTAHHAFSRIAALSGGAHAQFDLSSSHRLGELLAAASVWARGGKAAVQSLQIAKQSDTIRALLNQL